MISKVVIKNLRRFEAAEIEFSSGLNVLVGDNEAGKSTLLEAINLALTKRWTGRFFEQEFSHHFITTSIALAFVSEAKAGRNPQPPELIVEVYFNDDASLVGLKGTNNSLKEDVPGYRLRAALDEDFRAEYTEFLSKPDDVTAVPTEFYKVEWTNFAGHPVNVRALRVKASLIDASRIRLQSGADYHLQKIIGETLDVKDRAVLARSYRIHQEKFGAESSIQAVNKAVADGGAKITDKEFSLEIDTSGANGWETALTPHLDQLPFRFSGSGEQNRLKILLALARRVEESHVIMVEEPENHLSFTNLNHLVDRVAEQSGGRQVIVATHSSFVVNKLGLEQLMLLSGGTVTRLANLPAGTQDYFKKLSGYDTLRLVLADKVVLVEGPSDDLIFQRAYYDRKNRRAIEDRVDVISVRGLSAQRFLDLAVPLKRRAAVVTDNDGDYANKVDARYKNYTDAHDFLTIHRSDDNSRPTLEPQLLGANDLATLNKVVGNSYSSEAELLAYMENNKTDVALKFFETTEQVKWPKYIEEAIDALG